MGKNKEEKLRLEEARNDLYAFAKLLHEDLIEGWFHKELARVLMQFYEDLLAGKNPRVMIFSPPQHGKSAFVSRFFPAWVLGRDPNLQVVGCSYALRIANRIARDVKHIVDSPVYAKVFPKTAAALRQARKNTNGQQNKKNMEGYFEVHGGRGSYWASSINSSLTGVGLDIGIIDDPVKDFSKASKLAPRQSLWDWYTSTFYTRLSPKGGVLLCMTRWHDDDLAGRLLKQDKDVKDGWQVSTFKAIATEDEAFRRVGEALHPERFDLANLEKKKQMIGSSLFAAMYQQDPTALSRKLLQGDWFPRVKVLPALEWLAIFADTAQKAKESNDYSVLQLWGKGENGKIYLIDQKRGKWDALALTQTTTDFWRYWENFCEASRKKKHISYLDGKRMRAFSYGKKGEKIGKFMGENPRLRGLYIEDKTSGTSLIQQLQKTENIPLVPIPRHKDKITRFFDVQGYIESGLVCLLENASFTMEFLDECEAFRADLRHDHDDQIDPMMDAIMVMIGGSFSQVEEVKKAVSIYDYL